MYRRLLEKFDYAEVRVEKSNHASIQIKDDEIKQSCGSSSGMSARVLQEGSWGFASGTESIENLIERASRLASLGKGMIGISSPDSVNKEFLSSHEIVDAELQVKELLKASAEMKANGISSRMIACSDVHAKTEFYNSEGSDIVQETGYTYLSCSAVARSGEIIQRGAERAWSDKSFSEINAIKTAVDAKEKALRLVNAEPPPKGRFTVVLDPEMTGVLSHEAVGHACEADSVADKESVLEGRIGEEIGCELVTIVDDPCAKDFGHYEYDDEGVKAEKAVLVENGVLKNYMNSRETSEKLGISPNGHARAQDYSSVPVVRMSNTYFQKGKSAVDDVFDLAEGVYLKGMRGGSVDTFSGGFMFKAEEAYMISNGEKGRLMRDVTITGNILQTLKDVEAVGDDFGTSPGICGKFGQEAPVSDGGPHIRIRNIAIG
jgi:TldD protein